MTTSPKYSRPPQTALEVFEFLPEGTRCQLIDNTILMSPSPDIQHQIVSQQLETLISLFNSHHNLGLLLHAPLDVFFDDENIFQPDILFISNENKSIIQDGKIKGAPDLIVEILSPSSEKLDLGKKKTIYEKSGVKEYWTIQPKDNSTQVFILNKDNKYVLHYAGKSKFKSKLFKKLFSI